MDTIFFLTFAAIAVLCGVSVVAHTQPIKSALSLVGVMCALAVLYLQLGAEFIAATQVVVYAGAIMVLFVFVIMLVNAGTESKGRRSWPVWLLGIPMLIGLLALLNYVIRVAVPDTERVRFGEFTRGGPGDVGRVLFTKYLLPFEITSVLILVAILGAVVLARKEVDR